MSSIGEQLSGILSSISENCRYFAGSQQCQKLEINSQLSGGISELGWA